MSAPSSSGGNPSPNPPNSSNGKLKQMIARGRRGSAIALERLRSGSLPSWAGGPPPNVPTTPETIDEEMTIGFPLESIIESVECVEASSTLLSESKDPITGKVVRVVQMKQEIDPRLSRLQGNVDLGLVLSALYAKMVVVMGLAFPLSEVISSYIPPKFYDAFYIYLYVGSIIFMVSILGNVVRRKASRSARGFIERVSNLKSRLSSSSDSGVAPDVISNGHGPGHSDSESDSESTPLPAPVNSKASSSHSGGARKKERRARKYNKHESLEKVDSHSFTADGYPRIIHFGSFYLRMGAMAFGIGSLIYSGLEFGQYFELEKDTKCHNYMIALTPAVRMVFTFMQMYFIFLNSNMAIGKTSLGVQFGLMHMIGTNLCVWLNVLVEETRHEILHFYDPHTNKIRNHDHDHYSHGGDHHHSADPHGAIVGGGHGSGGVQNLTASDLLGVPSEEDEGLSRVRRGLKGMYECRRSNIMGTLVQNASPFLFPCTIEYSLICAAICYVMWKSTAKRRAARYSRYSRHNENSVEVNGTKRSPHHYTVDCARANKGLFLGIFVLVLTIMSLIVNFVLISRPGYKELAMMEVNITEVAVYTTTTLAVLLGMCQVRELRYDKTKNLELDNILLVVSQTGSFIYNVFTIIGGQFSSITHNKLVLMTALASLIQLLLQTLFIIDASKRTPATAEQANRKPGREVVTFLLVTNLAMWLINTLENSRGDSHPIQLKFYGIWAWTIITDISMPLAIFYRFHSTVCLCEIWKRAYKMKGT